MFVTLPTSVSGTLLTLSPIYNYLLGRGYKPEGQFIVIENWAVEFTPLVEEALGTAVVRDVNGVATRVFTAEHLAAISLQVGRARDHDRVSRFIEQDALDAGRFDDIIRRHGLLEKWHEFQQRYPQP